MENPFLKKNYHCYHYFSYVRFSVNFAVKALNVFFCLFQIINLKFYIVWKKFQSIEKCAYLAVKFCLTDGFSTYLFFFTSLDALAAILTFFLEIPSVVTIFGKNSGEFSSDLRFLAVILFFTALHAFTAILISFFAIFLSVKIFGKFSGEFCKVWDS